MSYNDTREGQNCIESCGSHSAAIVERMETLSGIIETLGETGVSPSEAAVLVEYLSRAWRAATCSLLSLGAGNGGEVLARNARLQTGTMLADFERKLSDEPVPMRSAGEGLIPWCRSSYQLSVRLRKKYWVEEGEKDQSIADLIRSTIRALCDDVRQLSFKAQLLAEVADQEGKTFEVVAAECGFPIRYKAFSKLPEWSPDHARQLWNLGVKPRLREDNDRIFNWFLTKLERLGLISAAISTRGFEFNNYETRFAGEVERYVKLSSATISS